MLEVNKGNSNMGEVITYLLEAFDYNARKKAKISENELQIKELKQQQIIDRLEILLKERL